jgi:mono/diheme cytochrome c family protein
MGLRVSILLLAVSFAVLADSTEDFENRVRPLLAKNCYACHRQTAMGGLRLDSRDAILKGGASGPAAVAGKPDESLLVQAVEQTHEHLKMPPTGKMKAEETAILRQWVSDGLFWPAEAPTQTSSASSNEYVITPEHRSFWSFQPVKRPAIPAVKGKALTAIDAFVLERIEKEGLIAAPRADKRSLIRRATIDLTGLPPTPEEVNAFLKDDSADAFAKVVDRLLASPHYGERWARHWLDIARYGDDIFLSTEDKAYPNSWRYRNWVIHALNRDMPYDTFVKAQLAGDQIGEPAGTGFYALSPEMQDDRVDATTRGFLGLTVACAQCHDHKFDPIPQKDFYSLQGVFTNTKLDEFPLADKTKVEDWNSRKKVLDKAEETLKKFYERQGQEIGEMLAARTDEYLLAARGLTPASDLDTDTLARWKKYLGDPRKDHPLLKAWYEAKTDERIRAEAAKLKQLVLEIIDEKKLVDKKNEIIVGLDPERRDLAGATLVSLDRDKYILWRDLFAKAAQDAGGVRKTPDGTFYVGDKTVDRFLHGMWKDHVTLLRKQVETAKAALPEKYPFYQIVSDLDKIAESRVFQRGDPNNPGAKVDRQFLMILSPGERKPFTKGAGRLELAEAIASKENPLTARVFVNRVWMHHMGRGIVATPSNFGQLGERPTHPELLDYLAFEFMNNGWSIKKLHREIMLTDVYARSAREIEENKSKDASNVWLWRANRRRLDAEALRDSMLFASGRLDPEPAERPAEPLAKTNKRTVYGFVGRRKLDGMLALFDFPSPVSTSEARMTTNVPPQRLFLMNSPFVEEQAKALAARVTGADDAGKIKNAYALLYGRDPEQREVQLGLDFLRDADWIQYARALLTSNEFLFVN